VESHLASRRSARNYWLFPCHIEQDIRESAEIRYMSAPSAYALRFLCGQGPGCREPQASAKAPETYSHNAARARLFQVWAPSGHH